MRYLSFILLLSLALAHTALATPETDSTEVKLAALGTQFITHLEKGEFPAALGMLDSTMTKALPGDKLADLWKSLPAQLGGAYQGRGPARLEKKGKYEVAVFDCKFGDKDLTLQVVLDGSGKVAGFWIRPPEKK